MPLTRSSKADASADIRQVPFSVPSGSICNRSIRSGSSRCSSRAINALKLAELKETQLKEELEAETAARNATDKQRLLKVKHEVEIARLSLEADDEDPDEVPPKEFIQDEMMQRYVSDCADNLKIIDSPVNSSTANIITKSICEALQPLASSFDLPKVEITPFDGNPSAYWKFTRQFEIYVKHRVNDLGQCFLLLLHYCRGKAREAIDGCVLLEPTEAYHRAIEILRDRFGNNHQVAEAILQELFQQVEEIQHSPDWLDRLALKMHTCEVALRQMDYTSDINAICTLERIVRGLPRPLQHRWAEVADKISINGNRPLFSDLREYISMRARIHRSRFGQLASDKGLTKLDKLPRDANIRGRTYHVDSQSLNAELTRSIKCWLCQGDHDLKACDKFLSSDVPSRWAYVRDGGCCFTCLRVGHRANNCRYRKLCSVDNCQKTHHTLLHTTYTTNKSVIADTGICQTTSTNRPNVMLGLIPIRVKGPLATVEVYALLDNGSDTTLVSQNLLSEIGANLTPAQMSISTINGSRNVRGNRSSFEISSLDGLEQIKIEGAFAVPNLAVDAPTQSPKEASQRWEHLRDLPFLDTSTRKVMLLIGCDVPEAHWTLASKYGRRKQPFAVKTLLGWVMFGPHSGFPFTKVHAYNTMASDPVENHLIEMYNHDFADTDAIEKHNSIEDTAAMKLVEKGVVYEDGHYVIPLPWRSMSYAKNNYLIAEKRLQHLKRRLMLDELLRERYIQAMENNFKKGYATAVPKSQSETDYNPRWYLPHHPVINPKKPDKIRIVFDCAAKYMGVSLNDQLYQGPDTNTDLVTVLLRFREGVIAVAADIEEMFLQVRVPISDRGALRFLWWPNSELNKEVQEYQLTVHPFGATSSPFCANFALKKTAEQFGYLFDKSASTSINANFYVDDCLATFQDEKSATQFVKDLTALLKLGGFRIHKWLSNRLQVLNEVPSAELAQMIRDLNPNNELKTKALGMEWNATEDIITFRFQFPRGLTTRRTILSAVSSLYDPLGLVAPILLPAKQLLQGLCRRGLSWDEPISDKESVSWNNWLNNIEIIHEIQFPRYLFKCSTSTTNQPSLHVFCDASELGYGAVAYARLQCDTDNSCCTLLFSKSRVAPVKPVTIPRLELTSAVLATKVAAIVNKAYGELFSATHFWTDSAIVLHYINNTSTRFSTFVANRLGTIHEASVPTQWKHVRSSNNPADMASRGINHLPELRRWIAGPAFLKQPESEWQVSKPITGDDLELEYKRSAAIFCNFSQTEQLSALFSHFSSWYRLMRACAWLIRFKTFIVNKTKPSRRDLPPTTRLTMRELTEAKLSIIRIIQKTEFADIKHNLEEQNSQPLPRRHPLSKLYPILINGVICVGGRLMYSQYATNMKHPIILPKKHPVTNLIIEFYHLLEGHCGPAHLHATLRQTYWIIQGGAAVKRTLGSCVTCRRKKAEISKQLMAPLPSIRTDPGWYPFEAVGVDYFGPILVKRGRALEKRYGCLFTCLKIRAVHLEIAYSLSTNSMIAALTRFIGRRGAPSVIYSDNGTNFVGASRELRRCQEMWDLGQIDHHLMRRGIQWNFNPPYASHRGGVWERLIRSVRKILYNLSNEQHQSDEGLQTLFVEAERILNNRPLAAGETSDIESDVLTPNHLLLLRDIPNVFPSDALECRLKEGWKRINYLTSVFWKRWSKEYVTTLQTRQRWLVKTRDFRQGDVVLVVSEQLPKNRWPLGLITECTNDKDDCVRTVTVKTAQGTLRRDIRKICLLEVGT